MIIKKKGIQIIFLIVFVIGMTACSNNKKDTSRYNTTKAKQEQEIKVHQDIIEEKVDEAAYNVYIAKEIKAENDLKLAKVKKMEDSKTSIEELIAPQNAETVSNHYNISSGKSTSTKKSDELEEMIEVSTALKTVDFSSNPDLYKMIYAKAISFYSVENASEIADSVVFLGVGEGKVQELAIEKARNSAIQQSLIYKKVTGTVDFTEIKRFEQSSYMDTSIGADVSDKIYEYVASGKLLRLKELAVKTEKISVDTVFGPKKTDAYRSIVLWAILPAKNEAIEEVASTEAEDIKVANPYTFEEKQVIKKEAKAALENKLNKKNETLDIQKQKEDLETQINIKLQEIKAVEVE